jgi:hypothetical protein
MLFVAGVDKDFRRTAEGAEVQAAQSGNPQTRATFLKVAKAYRQLARQREKNRSKFPLLEFKAGSLTSPLIWFGPACFCGLPSNDSEITVVEGGVWAAPQSTNLRAHTFVNGQLKS